MSRSGRRVGGSRILTRDPRPGYSSWRDSHRPTRQALAPLPAPGRQVAPALLEYPRARPATHGRSSHLPSRALANHAAATPDARRLAFPASHANQRNPVREASCATFADEAGNWSAISNIMIRSTSTTGSGEPHLAL